ncbi:MAG TPA: hypothetical protein VGX68_11605 [Thermoanaerobaculia bacterium]|jgi:hypothetical protein|nr:hypothetical protein [Thermoanaerobaculia bacterium]
MYLRTKNTMSSVPRIAQTLALLAVLLATGAECGPREKAAAVVSDFYTVYIPHRQGGLPEGAELQRLAPFLSERLHASIVAALDYQEAWEKRHPEDKPPFVDGDFFSSLFEGPESFKVSRVTVSSKTAWKVQVHFRYETVEWDDTVLVIAERGRYKIDEVLYSGAGEFNPPGRLSERLKSREE